MSKWSRRFFNIFNQNEGTVAVQIVKYKKNDESPKKTIYIYRENRQDKMKNYYNQIKNDLLDLDYEISHENETDGLLVIQKEGHGIKNMIVGVAPPIVILEQFIFDLKQNSEHIFRSLLQKNRDIIHGAFVLNEDATKVIFRDTLQIENLDQNELEASLNSLSLLLSEYSEKIINFSKL